MSNTTRCKHCNTKYVFETTSTKFCPACQRVINEALLKVPKKFDHKFVEITDGDMYENINNIFNEEKEKHPNDGIKFNFSVKNINNIQELINDGKYLEEIEILYHNRKKYVRGRYKNKSEYHIFVDMEYSTLTNNITDYWYYYDFANNNTFYSFVSLKTI